MGEVWEWGLLEAKIGVKESSRGRRVWRIGKGLGGSWGLLGAQRL